MNKETNKVRDRILAIFCGAIIGTAMFFISIYGMAFYGAVLFLLTPLVAATTSAFIYRLRQPDEYGWTFTVSYLSLMLPACLLLFTGLEGLICVVMAALPAAIFGFFGTVIGLAAADRFELKSSHLAMVVFVLPLMGGAESAIVTPSQFCRRNSIVSCGRM